MATTVKEKMAIAITTSIRLNAALTLSLFHEMGAVGDTSIFIGEESHRFRLDTIFALLIPINSTLLGYLMYPQLFEDVAAKEMAYRETCLKSIAPPGGEVASH